jgi:hypothetical protein
MDKPDNFQDIIENIIKINNRFYEKSLEKKDLIILGKNKKKKERNKEIL